jgi:diaminopimelate epimerase
MTSSRWHAHGNAYLVVDEEGYAIDDGLDGAVEIVSIDGDEIEILIVNPDRSLAEMSGNGTRIAGAWLMRQTGHDVARVRVGPRVVEVRSTADGLYESDLGDVEVQPREPIGGYDVVRVSVGNPHAVVEGEPDEIGVIGPALETHPRFPDRTNVQVVHVDGPGEVTARVWERGVGETTASGSSAVAVAAATHADGEVLVHFPGGDLRVRLADGRATLTGPAEPVG